MEVRPHICYLGKLLPHMCSSSELLPHIHYSCELIPHMCSSSELLPHIHYSCELIPHMCSSNELLPHIHYSHELIPHMCEPIEHEPNTNTSLWNVGAPRVKLSCAAGHELHEACFDDLVKNTPKNRYVACPKRCVDKITHVTLADGTLRASTRPEKRAGQGDHEGVEG